MAGGFEKIAIVTHKNARMVSLICCDNHVKYNFYIERFSLKLSNGKSKKPKPFSKPWGLRV